MWWEYQGTVRSCLLTKVEVSSSCLWSLDLSIWASLQGGDSTEATQPAALRNGATGAEKSGFVAFYQPDTSPGGQGPSGSSAHTTQSQAF